MKGCAPGVVLKQRQEQLGNGLLNESVVESVFFYRCLTFADGDCLIELANTDSYCLRLSFRSSTSKKI